MDVLESVCGKGSEKGCASNSACVYECMYVCVCVIVQGGRCCAYLRPCGHPLVSLLLPAHLTTSDASGAVRINHKGCIKVCLLRENKKGNSRGRRVGVPTATTLSPLT